MADLNARQKIQDAEQEVTDLKQAYLRSFGWDCTSNTPGAYWLWRRDFVSDDAARHKRWKDAGPGPLGWPSEPKPYGVITAPLDLAVSITMRSLDDDLDQDGDPETPRITHESLEREQANTE